MIKDACRHADYEHLLLVLHAPLIHISNGVADDALEMISKLLLAMAGDES